MLKKAQYYTNEQDSITQLIKLMLQLIQMSKSILICSQNQDLSSMLWKNHTFMPHGVHGDKFWEHQPVLIVNRIHDELLTKYDVFVNFQHVFMSESDHMDIILWNCDQNLSDFQQHTHHQGRWQRH